MIGNYSHKNGINYDFFFNTIKLLFVVKIFEYLFILIINQYQTLETPGGEISNYLHKD